MQEGKRVSVAVATMRERVALWPFVDARYRLCSEAQRWGIETRLVEEATIYVGDMRSKLSRAVAESRYTHLFFLDADSVPPESALVCLVAHDVDIVSGLYFMRSEAALPVAYVRQEGEEGADLCGRADTLGDYQKAFAKALELAYISADWGAAALRGRLAAVRTVLEEVRVQRTFYRSVWPETAAFLNEHQVPPVNRPVMVGNPLLRPELWEVDVVGAGCLLIRKEVLQACSSWSMEGVGEDVSWCERVRELGFKIHVDPGVICAHLETVPLGTEHFRQGQEARRRGIEEAQRGRDGAREDGASAEGGSGEDGPVAPGPGVPGEDLAGEEVLCRPGP